MVQRFYQWTRGLNPWLPYFLVTFVFQIIRGSVVDAVVFGIASAILFADWKNLIPWQFAKAPQYRRTLVVAGIVVAATVLFLAPRASWIDATLLLLIAPMVLAMVYYSDGEPLGKATRPMNMAKTVWSLVLVSMAVFEMFAYIWANIYKDDHHFPTVSVLMEPVLANKIGRTIFLLVWMALGTSLLRLWRRSK